MDSGPESGGHPRGDFRGESRSETGRDSRAESKRRPRCQMRAEQGFEPRLEMRFELGVELRSEERFHARGEPCSEPGIEPRVEVADELEGQLPADPRREAGIPDADAVGAGNRRTFLGPASSNHVHREAPLSVQTLLQSTAGTLARVPLLGRFSGVVGLETRREVLEIAGARETAPLLSAVRVRLLTDQCEPSLLGTIA